MDLMKAFRYRFQTDASIRFENETYAAHRLILYIRSLPLAQLFDEGGTDIDVTHLFSTIALPPSCDPQACFAAILQFTATDWLMDTTLPNLIVMTQMAKILQMPFLFSVIATRMISMTRTELDMWPLVVNALWVPADTDLGKMLLAHEEGQGGSDDTLPFDAAFPLAREHIAEVMGSPHIPLLSLEALCALLGADFLASPLSPEHLEHLLLQGCLRWVQHHPEHVHVLALIKMPLLPAGALEAERARISGDPHNAVAISPALLEEGAKAPAIPLTQQLIEQSGGVATEPGSVLWRLVERRTGGGGGRGRGRGQNSQVHQHQHQHQQHHHDSAAEDSDVRPQTTPPQPTPLAERRSVGREGSRSGSGGGGGGRREERVRLAAPGVRGEPSQAYHREMGLPSPVQGRVPETVLQNDGKPPVQFHEYVFVFFVWKKGECRKIKMFGEDRGFQNLIFLFVLFFSFACRKKTHPGTATSSRTTPPATSAPCSGRPACALPTAPPAGVS